MSFSMTKIFSLFFAFFFSFILSAPVSSSGSSLLMSPPKEVSKGVFLVATDRLSGSFFHRSVILIVKHDNTGAVGVILNKPTQFPIASTFPNINPGKKQDVFYVGGPVMHKYVFSLLKTKRRLDKTAHVFGDVFFEGVIRRGSSSVRKLESGEKLKLFVGYSGWASGQLENEIKRGDWILSHAEQKDLFNEKTETLWQDLMDKSSLLWAQNEPLNFFTQFSD